MTDAAHNAKLWLNRLIDLYNRAAKTERAYKMLEYKINHSVGSYENIGCGRTDPIIRQQQREDALIDYSEKKAQFEREYYEFLKQEIITLNVIDCMQNHSHAALLIERYINRDKWADIFKNHAKDYKKTQLMQHHDYALEELAAILEREKPRATQEAERSLRERFAAIRATA